MYTISDKTINIPGDTDLKHFCLIGFKEEYEYLNAVNYVVKTELYEVKDRNKRMFDVKLPDYAKDFNIMYYKPETFSFKIKNKKLKGPRVKYELRE